MNIISNYSVSHQALCNCPQKCMTLQPNNSTLSLIFTTHMVKRSIYSSDKCGINCIMQFSVPCVTHIIIFYLLHSKHCSNLVVMNEVTVPVTPVNTAYIMVNTSLYSLRWTLRWTLWCSLFPSLHCIYWLLLSLAKGLPVNTWHPLMLSLSLRWTKWHYQFLPL